MIMIHDVMNFDELAQSIEHVSNEICRRREAGQLGFPDVQQLANYLTRAQLVLNELERIEIRERGVSREMAERFAALETSLRTIQDELYQALQCRKSLPSARSNDAYDPAGR